MKLTPLQALHASERAKPRRQSGEERSLSGNGREHDIAKMRFPDRFTKSYLSMTDQECERVLLENVRPIYERGTVSADDSSDRQTVQRFGYACLKQGWSIVPQDRPGTYGPDSDDKAQRKPSKIPSTTWHGPRKLDAKERFFAFLPSQWRERRMGLHDFLTFEEISGANLALQCCEASGHIRALDIDCPDPTVATRVRELAVQHLGDTPFVRIGASPKAQLLYRVEGSDIDVASWSVQIHAEPEEIQSIEWLGHGKLITAYGLHHRTMKNFDWSQGQLHPAIAGPEHAPVVTKAMLRAFTNALQSEWKIAGAAVTSNPTGGKSEFTEFDRISANLREIWTPKVSRGQWTLDDRGRVIDGAEKWLSAQAWALCAANAETLDKVRSYLVEWLEMEARDRLLGVHRSNPALQTEGGIARETKVKIDYAAAKWKNSLANHRATGKYSDNIVPWRIATDGRRPLRQRVAPSARPADGSLDWIPDEACAVEELADRMPAAKTLLVAKMKAQFEADRDARALIHSQEKRKRVSDGVSIDVRAAIAEWLATVAVWNGLAPAAPWVLKAPTGAGKTVGTIDELVAFCQAHPRKPGEGPILFVLATHMNADEAMDKAVQAGMFAPELWTEKQLDELESKFGATGVKIAQFRGRIASNCQQSEKMTALTSRGIGASGLCGAEVEEGDELDKRDAKRSGEKLPKVEILCPFRQAGTCGYFRQMADLETADIIVLPHAYLTIAALPKALRKPRAVIIDESVTYQLLGQTRMPVSTLSMARREPYVTKTDKTKFPGLDAKEISKLYFAQREELCAMALEWLATGKDVAVELGKLADGRDLIAAAILVCDRANDRSRKVRPDMDMKQVEALVGEATGRFLLAEIRFWKLVRERMDNLAAGTAKGKHDARWQIVEDLEVVKPATETTPAEMATTPHLRLSWRVTPNWAGFPTLLLDASANTRIVSKLFADAPIVRTVTAPFHVRTVAMIERTWSNASFIPRWDASDDELKAIAETIEQARRLITTTAVLYGHGRVLVGTTIAVREVLTGGDWTPPPNIDFVHFGNLRGLDFAKHHVAAISIGRSEQPIAVIDGYAAALTYDDDEPEAPVDALGTGLTMEGKPLFRTPAWRRIRMRSGQDVDHLVPCMPSKPVIGEHGRQLYGDGKPLFARTWGQELEESWREEEIRQFLGRLRPVYRGVDDDAPPPVWIATGKILPDDVVVDELAEMASLLKAYPMAELVRLGGGVLADKVTPHLPGAQDILQGRDLAGLAKDLPTADAFIKRWLAPFAHVKYTLASETSGLERRYRSAMLLPGWIEGDATDLWISLSERYTELPDIVGAAEPRLAVVVSKVKPADKRDRARGDAMLSEIELRDAHRDQPLAVEHSRVEFELRQARDLYSALSDAADDETVEPCASTSKSTPSNSTPKSVNTWTRRFGLPSLRGSQPPPS